MSTPWGTSPYATPTPVIDSVTRNPAPNPVPIPGLMPLGFPQFMAPQAAVPYMGMPPQYMVPQAPAPYMGMPAQFMAPQAAVPYMGMPPQYMVPQAPAPYMGMPALGLHPAQALGLDMQMTPSPMAGLGGHAAVFPVITLLLSQLGLREAVSRIGDEALKQRVTASVNEAIDRTIEGVSGDDVPSLVWSWGAVHDLPHRITTGPDRSALPRWCCARWSAQYRRADSAKDRSPYWRGFWPPKLSSVVSGEAGATVGAACVPRVASASKLRCGNHCCTSSRRRNLSPSRWSGSSFARVNQGKNGDTT